MWLVRGHLTWPKLDQTGEEREEKGRKKKKRKEKERVVKREALPSL